MTIPKKYYVPFVTAVWMIAVPIAFWFLAGAGADTVLDWPARLLGTLFSIFGGASAILGALILVWIGWQMWRGGDLTRRADVVDD